jgi:hypothetical protein
MCAWEGARKNMQDSCPMIGQEDRLWILCGEDGITDISHNTRHFQQLECHVLGEG